MEQGWDIWAVFCDYVFQAIGKTLYLYRLDFEWFLKTQMDQGESKRSNAPWYRCLNPLTLEPSFVLHACKAMERCTTPHSAVLACGDVQAPMDVIFDAMPGEMFVMRNAPW